MTSDVVVVGAGVAGLAAASALAGAGAAVTVVERKPLVGGRAYSYAHPALQEVIDCQHVLLGCCTNLRHLCDQTGVDGLVRWYDELTFLETNGRASRIRPNGLPSPMHSSMSFLRAAMLGVGDKVAIARGLVEFLRDYPQDDRESVAAWLKRTGQTERAIKHFWEPVIVGALNDGFESCSVKYAGQVFHESFLKSAEGGRLGIPAMPLSELYGHVAEAAGRKGAQFRLKSNVRSVSQADGKWKVMLEDDLLTADAVILAVPFEQVGSLLAGASDSARSGAFLRSLEGDLEHFKHAPITTVHLWFDREITELDHAVLLDTEIQWIFHKSRIRRWPTSAGSYVELVISASFAELRESREELLANALRELEIFFPAVKSAVLRKSGILKEARATFSVVPGLDGHRPAQVTPVRGLFLAGDWTRTEWPSTMEGGVRSGYMAAEGVAAAMGSPTRFLQPDLPAAGLMRWLAGK